MAVLAAAVAEQTLRLLVAVLLGKAMLEVLVLLMVLLVTVVAGEVLVPQAEPLLVHKIPVLLAQEEMVQLGQTELLTLGAALVDDGVLEQ